MPLIMGCSGCSAGAVAGVACVNDSKATNVASAIAGIESFAGGLHLILGGRGKGSGYDALREPVAASCAAVYLIGEAAGAIGAALEGAGVPVEFSTPSFAYFAPPISITVGTVAIVSTLLISVGEA